MPKYIKSPEEVKLNGLQRVLKIFKAQGDKRRLEEEVTHLRRVNAILKQRVERGLNEEEG